jgi:hypothetical protein
MYAFSLNKSSGASETTASYWNHRVGISNLVSADTIDHWTQLSAPKPSASLKLSTVTRDNVKRNVVKIGDTRNAYRILTERRSEDNIKVKLREMRFMNGR